MASDRTLQLRAQTSQRQAALDKAAEIWRTRQPQVALRPGKRHGDLRKKLHGSSKRRSRRAFLKTLPRSIRRLG